MSHRKDRKEELRQEREQRERQAAEAAQRKKLVGYGAAGVLVLAAIVAIILAAGGGGGDDGGAATPDRTASNSPTVSYSDDPPAIPDQRVFDLRPAARAAGCRLVDPPNEGNEHVADSVTYRANPPTSGNHDQIPTEDGAYTQAPRTENSVHSLEHGRIEIQFKANLAQQRIDQLKALFDEDSYHMLLFPNGTNMPYEVAATAWDHALVCEKFSDGVFDAIRAFKDQYRDQGPEFVP